MPRAARLGRRPPASGRGLRGSPRRHPCRRATTSRSLPRPAEAGSRPAARSAHEPAAQATIRIPTHLHRCREPRIFQPNADGCGGAGSRGFGASSEAASVLGSAGVRAGGRPLKSAPLPQRSRGAVGGGERGHGLLARLCLIRSARARRIPAAQARLDAATALDTTFRITDVAGYWTTVQTNLAADRWGCSAPSDSRNSTPSLARPRARKRQRHIVELFEFPTSTTTTTTTRTRLSTQALKCPAKRGSSTLVEPGGFSTDWSGSPPRHSEPLSVYDDMRERQRQRPGRQRPRRSDRVGAGDHARRRRRPAAIARVLRHAPLGDRQGRLRGSAGDLA